MLDLTKSHRGHDYILFAWSPHEQEMMILGWGKGIILGDTILAPEGSFIVTKLMYRESDPTDLWVLTAKMA